MYIRYRCLVLSTSRTEVNLFCSVGALSYNLFMSIFIFVGDGGHFTRVFQRFCTWAERGYPASPQKKSRFRQGGASALGNFSSTNVEVWEYFMSVGYQSGISVFYSRRLGRVFRSVLVSSSNLLMPIVHLCRRG